MRKVYIETHGCQMNVHDSEKAVAALSTAGFEHTVRLEEADLILLNTCMVREKPEQKVYKRIQFLKHQRMMHSSEPPLFGIMGCVAQAEATRIFDKTTDVRLVIGTQSIDKLPVLINELSRGFSRAIDVQLTKDAAFFEIPATLRKSSHIGYISIIEGCNKFCSYCIVPHTRGRERSRPADNILCEAQQLASQGVKEIHLLGQNVNSYGLSGKLRGNLNKFGGDDIVQSGITFASLLRLLAEESKIPRIKYTTSYPRDFDAELLRVMDDYENLCEWIHLPVQSGSNRILKMMRRGYSAGEYLRKIEQIRAARKDYSITGDIIVGFPGETEEDFLETYKLVAEVQYDGLYIFQYSPRPNTAAIAYGDTVPEAVKNERLVRLVELQARMQNIRYSRYLGRTVEVLVEGPSQKSEADFAGHTRCHKTVNFPRKDSQTGELVQVKITEIGKNSLRGEIQ